MSYEYEDQLGEELVNFLEVNINEEELVNFPEVNINKKELVNVNIHEE
ncbi:4723_t:CDS:1, partial [Funneliformis geosporum]